MKTLATPHLFSEKFSARLLALSIMFFLAAPFLQVQQASGSTKQLMMNPVRLIFNGRQRALQVSILNPTDNEIQYAISLFALRKGSDGRWFQPKERTADEEKIEQMIRYSPRRAKIAANSKQVVKFMLRKPAGLAEGEYRARLMLSPIGNKQPRQTQLQPGEKSSFNLDVVVNSTFPIIIQHGGSPATVEPLAMTLIDDTKGGKAVQARYRRQGKFSSFGNVDLLYLPPGGNRQDWRKIGRTRGLAIYTPETEAESVIMLENITGKELDAGGMLRLEYQHNNGHEPARKRPDAVQEFQL